MGKVLSHPLVILAFCVVCGVLVFGLRKTSEKSELSAESIKSIEQDVEKTATEVESLRKETEFATTNFAKERIARNELLLQKPGEYVVQVVTPEVEETTVVVEGEERTPWQEWKMVLFE